MMTSPTPKFVEGDRVVDFRGHHATIKTVRQVDEPGKSHRVTVTWVSEVRNPDQIEYYEEVFDAWSPSSSAVESW